MPARLPDSLLPPPEELSELFSEVTGDPEKIDDRDRLLLSVWEEKVRPKILQRSQSPTAEPHRWRLPDERRSITARFEIPATGEKDEFVGYITMGMYDDDYLGELFLSIAKEGSFVSGIMDAFVTAVSIGLQHGIPLSTFARKFKHSGFEPSGMVVGAPTGLQGSFFKSVLDYLFQYLEHKFPDGRLPPRKAEDYSEAASPTEASSGGAESTEASTPKSSTEASTETPESTATSAVES